MWDLVYSIERMKYEVEESLCSNKVKEFDLHNTPSVS